MTPTHLCQTMNKVYEMLRTLTLEELNRMISVVNNETDPKIWALLRHQIEYTIYKKNIGKW